MPSYNSWGCMLSINQNTEAPLLTLCVQQLYEMHRLVSKTLPAELASFVTPEIMEAAGCKVDANRPLLSSEQPYLVTIRGLSAALTKAYTKLSELGQKGKNLYKEIAQAEKESKE